jgi:hypothetical protein
MVWESQQVRVIAVRSDFCVVNECVSFVSREQTTEPQSPCCSFLFSCRNCREADINPLEVTDRRLSTADPSALKMDIVTAHSFPRDGLSLQVVASICLVRLMQ